MKNETPEEWGYEAKFSVRTDFLDTTFRRNRQQKEGESYEDYCVEMHREMLGVIDRLKKEFASPQGNLPPEAYQYSPLRPSSLMPIIDKRWDQFEVDIDNAETLEELEAIVRHYDTFPGRFLTVINDKRQSFKL